MNILLVNPRNKSCEYSFTELPLGLAYIYDSVTKYGCTCELLDLNNLAQQQTINSISLTSFDLVGISCNSYQIESVAEIISVVKKTSSIPIVVGGPHATLLPNDVVFSSVDFIVVGEGEMAIRAIIDLLTGTSERLPSNVITEGLVNNSTMITLSESQLDMFSPYSWDFFNNYATTTMLYSRGCNGSCRFCSAQSLWQNKIRAHSARWLIESLDRLNQFGKNNVLFVDDNFFSPPLKKRLGEILPILKDFHESKGFSFVANSRIDDFPIDLIDRLAECGFAKFSFGIEEITSEDTPTYSKAISFQYVSSLIDKLHKREIKVRTSWILGLPEYQNNLCKYQRFSSALCQLQSDEISIHWLIPYPGSYFWSHREDFFYITDASILPSYNCIPYELYKYLDKEEIETITEMFRLSLQEHGYSESHQSNKYFYLPTNSIGSKKSII